MDKTLYTHTHTHIHTHREGDRERGFPSVSVVKNPPANARDIRDAGLIPGCRRSPRGRHGNPLQYSCLENPWTEEPGGLQSMGSIGVGHD